MKPIPYHRGLARAMVLVLGLVAACAPLFAQDPTPPPSAPPKFSAADLEKLAAPIALHPDPLIAIILPASVYPLEIVQAARFVRDTNNLPKLDEQPWDENVRSVAKFPSLIAMMDADLAWTSDLGQAFLDQQKELMDVIQGLRSKANAAGVLKTTPQQIIVVTNTVIERTVERQVVVVTNTIVQIQPSNPEVVYVPTYPPSIYYYYPPVVYAGPPPVVTFAVGIAVGAIIANNCDWHGGGIYVGHHGVAVWGGGGYHGHGGVNINGDVNINTGNINVGNRNTSINNRSATSVTASKWQPDQSRLRSSGAPGSKGGVQASQARGWNAGPTRPASSPGLARPSATPSYSRPAAKSSYSRPMVPATKESAFSGMSSGGASRNFSQRGSVSRGGGGRGGRSFGNRR